MSSVFSCTCHDIELKPERKKAEQTWNIGVWLKLLKWLSLFFLSVHWRTETCVVSAGNESCPQPQTSEHLAAVEIMKLKHILILQNKIDLVKETQAKEQHEQILAFVKGKTQEYCFIYVKQIKSNILYILNLKKQTNSSFCILCLTIDVS